MSRKRLLIIAACALAAAAVVAVAVFIFAVSPIATRTHRCAYLVTGSNPFGGTSALISYRNESGGLEQKVVILPWSQEIKSRSGFVLSLSGQKQESPNAIYAVIYIDGKTVQQAETTAPYGVVSVSARVP